jgi:uncharacterized membrane protein
VLGAVGLFLVCFWLVGKWFWGRHQIVDTPEYQTYGNAIRAGLTPYRDFHVEYPPGALPAFVLPTYVGSYTTTFGALMAVCGMGIVALVGKVRPTAVAIGFIAVSPLLLGSMIQTRFDLWPSLLVVAAVAAFVYDRDVVGWAALAAAFAVKLFPAVLVPLAVVWTLRRRGVRTLLWGLVAAAVVIVAAFGPFVVLAPHGLWASIHDQASRPLQIEALAASVLMTFGHPIVYNPGSSFDLKNQPGLGTLSVVVQVGTLVALWVAFARGPMESARFVRYAAAAVCAFVVFGKVFSPQYLIWLVPLVPLVGGRRGLAALGFLVAALVATQVYFPARYFQYVDSYSLAWVVLLRNLLLVALLAVLILPARSPAPLRSG